MEHNGFLEPADDVYSQWGIGVYSNILSENYKAFLSCGFDSFDANIYRSKGDDYKRDAAKSTK